MVALVVGLCLLAGRLGICLLLAAAGIIALREYATLLKIETTRTAALLAAYAITVVNYLLILFDQPSAFLVFVPLGGLALLAVVQLVQGKAPGYIRTTGGLFWGVVVIVYGMSHAAYLFILPASSGGPAGPAGWFLFLLILTEADDIFQAIIGRAIGAGKRHRIAPVISPNKTWEGLIGGNARHHCSGSPPCSLADDSGTPPTQHLPLPAWLQSFAGAAIAGVLITVAGFFGDINMSGIKRDSGVKDSSNMMPGMGGFDRPDRQHHLHRTRLRLFFSYGGRRKRH